MDFAKITTKIAYFFNEDLYGSPTSLTIGLNQNDYDVESQKEYPAFEREFLLDADGNFADSNGVEDGVLQLWKNGRGSTGSRYYIKYPDNETIYFVIPDDEDVNEYTTVDLRAFGTPPGDKDATFYNLLAANTAAVEAKIQVFKPYFHLEYDYNAPKSDSLNNSIASGVDAATHLQAALNATLLQNGGTIVVPRGVTLLKSDVLVNFNGKRGQIRLVGSGADSIIRVEKGATNLITIQNTTQLIIENLTFTGTPGYLDNPNFYDVAKAVFQLSFINQISVRDCKFLNFAITAPYDLTYATNKDYGIIAAAASDLLIERTIFGGNSMNQTGSVCVTDWAGLTVKDSDFIDYDSLGSWNDLQSKTGAGGTAWLRAVNPAAALNPPYRGKIKLENVCLDETSSAGQLLIDGAKYVECNSVGINSGVNGYGFSINNVENFTAKDCYVVYTHNEVGVWLYNVGRAELKNLHLGEIVKYIQTAGSTRSVEMNNCTLPGGALAANGVINDSGAELTFIK